MQLDVLRRCPPAENGLDKLGSKEHTLSLHWKWNRQRVWVGLLDVGSGGHDQVRVRLDSRLRQDDSNREQGSSDRSIENMCARAQSTQTVERGNSSQDSSFEPLVRQRRAVRALLVHGKYRHLVHNHLGQFLERLFADFTGVHFHIAWAPDLPQPWDARTLPSACYCCCRMVGAGPQQRAECARCGPRRLAIALHSHTGHCFSCHLGVRNCWVPIRVRGETLGLAYLQALDHAPAWRSSPVTSRWGQAQVLGRLHFARAARLLRFMVQHAEISSLADLRKADLANAGHAVVALEKKLDRLREALRHHLPNTPQTPRRAGAASHADHVVQSLLEWVEQDYHRPLTLRQCAGQLGMNPAYLSALFSRVVRLPFKTYLTELRLERAKELLGKADRNLADVAQAVGYASENRFRSAFKKATGLPPKLWRETMQTKLRS